jgi:hypothetical protein
VVRTWERARAVPKTAQAELKIAGCEQEDPPKNRKMAIKRVCLIRFSV